MKVKEYAALMGMHPDSVRRSIRNGDIPATQHGREWEIDEGFANSQLKRETRFVNEKESAYLIRKRLVKQRNDLYEHLAIVFAPTTRDMKEIYVKHGGKVSNSFIEEVDKTLNAGNGVLDTLEKIKQVKMAIAEIESLVDLRDEVADEYMMEQVKTARNAIVQKFGTTHFWGDTPPGAKDED